MKKFYLGQPYWVHPEFIFLLECIRVQSYEIYVFIFRKKKCRTELQAMLETANSADYDALIL